MRFTIRAATTLAAALLGLMASAGARADLLAVLARITPDKHPVAATSLRS